MHFRYAFIIFLATFNGFVQPECTSDTSDVCTSDSVTRILLIRHGESDWNVVGKRQGHSNISSLTNRGRKQAKRVASLLIDHGETIDALYSSDLTRAYSTAHEIADVFGLSVITDSELRERHTGDVEGMQEKDIVSLYGAAIQKLEETYPDRWQRWHHTAIPNAETTVQVITRIERFIKTTAQKHKGTTVAAVTHGAVMKNLIIHKADIVLSIPNCCIAEFQYNYQDDEIAFVSLTTIPHEKNDDHAS
jgi:broad specificity phosphatase PhoE